jgi:gas vesicle protein
MPHHEHEQTKGTRSGAAGKVALAGVIGAAAGAATAMLLSPWRGAEARLRLKDRMRGACFKAKDVTSKAKEVASKAKDVLPRRGTED